MKDLKAYGLYILEKSVSKRLVSTMSEQLRMALAMKSSKRVLRATTKRFEFKVLKLTLLTGATWFGNAGWENEYNFEPPKETTLSDN